MQNLDNFLQNNTNLQSLLNITSLTTTITSKSYKILLSHVKQSKSTQDFYLCGLIFQIILSDFPNVPEYMLNIETANFIFSICETIKGSILSNKLATNLMKLLEK